MQTLHIPETGQKRVVIIGIGFAGLKLAKKLAKQQQFQVVLLDKNNYYQFQPLYYQVATSGLEPSSIIYPIRKNFQKKQNVFIRICEVQHIDYTVKMIVTSEGSTHYDYLVIATGADTNYYGMQNIMANAMPMKTVTEAISIRNKVLGNMECALTVDDKEPFFNIVIVGGGPTGVELAGALSEMKSHIFPKDYPEMDFSAMRIVLVEASGKLLAAMSEQASAKSKAYLDKMGVEVRLSTQVKDYDGTTALLGDGNTIKTHMLIWAAGVKPNIINGMDSVYLSPRGRIKVDSYSRVPGLDNVFAIGDVAEMESKEYPKGHPQVAQPALQQGTLLAKNLVAISQGRDLQPFRYKDLGSMATIGRGKAVVDLPFLKFSGLIAWFAWLFLHLMYILGVKNKLFIFLNWCWAYIAYDQSLRLIIKSKEKNKTA